MPKVNNYSNSSWRIIDTPAELQEISEFLKEYQIWNPSDTSIILKYGYKNLNTGDKETYYCLKDLALINQKKTNSTFCKVSLEYLAIALGTSSECQRLRIVKLKNAKLITTIISKNHSANMYFMNLEPLPDSTFVDTIQRLATRKKLYDLVRAVKYSNNTAEKLEIMQQIKELDPTGEFQKQTIPHLVNDPEISAEDLIDHYSDENIFLQ